MDNAMTPAELWDQMKDERFLCDTCGEYHPLIEHRDCRGTTTAGRRRPGAAGHHQGGPA